jgi:hypothetical protein
MNNEIEISNDELIEFIKWCKSDNIYEIYDGYSGVHKYFYLN